MKKSKRKRLEAKLAEELADLIDPPSPDATRGHVPVEDMMVELGRLMGEGYIFLVMPFSCRAGPHYVFFLPPSVYEDHC